MILCDADRLVDVAQGVLSHHLVLALAEDHANGGRIVLPFHLRINGGEIEAELARMVGLEGGGLELDHHITAQLEVIEEQIDEEVFATHFQRHLATHVGKAGAQLQQEAGM